MSFRAYTWTIALLALPLTACMPPAQQQAQPQSGWTAASHEASPPDGSLLTQKCRKEAETASMGLGRKLFGHELKTNRTATADYFSQVDIRFTGTLDINGRSTNGYYICKFTNEALTSFEPTFDPPQGSRTRGY